MVSRGRVGLSVVALLAAAVGLSACLGAPPPPPPAPQPPPPPSPPAGVSCQALETLSLESDAANAVAYEAVVEADDGTEYVSFEAATDAEIVEQVAEIEATVGPVTEFGEQTEVGILDVTPTDDPRYGGSLPLGGQQKTALDQVKFHDAWSNDADGAGVVVAVVDTGVQSHPDLASNLLPGVDFVTPGGACGDPNGHGTHVAGILGQVDNTTGGIGGAPGVKVLPVRVLDGNGSGSPATVGNGIRWAADNPNGVDVINLSLGSLGAGTAIPDAVEYAVDKGITVVAAAGNCGNPANLPVNQCGTQVNATTYPAALSNVVAVGAVNTGLLTRASFSNNNTYVDIAAPGTSIDSTLHNDGYGPKSGTSMATPFVSAAAALILGHCPMTPAAILAKLQASATVAVTNFSEPEELVDAYAASATCP